MSAADQCMLSTLDTNSRRRCILQLFRGGTAWMLRAYSRIEYTDSPLPSNAENGRSDQASMVSES
jgi:hypothetical protein